MNLLRFFLVAVFFVMLFAGAAQANINCSVARQAIDNLSSTYLENQTGIGCSNSTECTKMIYVGGPICGMVVNTRFAAAAELMKGSAEYQRLAEIVGSNCGPRPNCPIKLGLVKCVSSQCVFVED